jgi:hypothetical protein
MRLINGYQESQALHVAAMLGVADHLKDGPKSYDDLAQASGAHPTLRANEDETSSPREFRLEGAEG